MTFGIAHWSASKDFCLPPPPSAFQAQKTQPAPRTLPEGGWTTVALFPPRTSSPGFPCVGECLRPSPATLCPPSREPLQWGAAASLLRSDPRSWRAAHCLPIRKGAGDGALSPHNTIPPAARLSRPWSTWELGHWGSLPHMGTVSDFEMSSSLNLCIGFLVC